MHSTKTNPESSDGLTTSDGVSAGPPRPNASGSAASPGPQAPLWQTEEARLLRLAAAEVRTVPRLTSRRPDTTMADAYALQWYTASLRVDEGDRVLGYKVGLTSRAMQEQFGMDEPDSGVLLASMQVPAGGTVNHAGLLTPRVEAEVAFRLGADLRGDEVDEGDVRAVLDGVCLALEVIDCRYEPEGITLVDSVADNAACAGFVLGEFVLPGWDLRHERLSVHVDGVAMAQGEGRDVLGDPIRSLVWLTRRLAKLGRGLRAGEVVLTGAVHASLPLTAGQFIRVFSPNLPGVSLRVA
ncbi:2-keto-4-pentenoate hydratase [Kitasatospora sp. NPDC098663]|uniref:2-keto-4-pentenoate hydratase n=1 Tax=Kitasatospora sp. NPDC098663 TaxID=3364096 RepID=UPI0037F86069